MLGVTLVLSAQDRQALQHLVKRIAHWRVRARAQSVLLLASGLTCQPWTASVHAITWLFSLKN